MATIRIEDDEAILDTGDQGDDPDVNIHATRANKRRKTVETLCRNQITETEGATSGETAVPPWFGPAVTEAINLAVTSAIELSLTDTVNQAVTNTVSQAVTDAIKQAVSVAFNQTVAYAVNRAVTDAVNRRPVDTVNRTMVNPVNQTRADTVDQIRMDSPNRTMVNPVNRTRMDTVNRTLSDSTNRTESPPCNWSAMATVVTEDAASIDDRSDGENVSKDIDEFDKVWPDGNIQFFLSNDDFAHGKLTPHFGYAICHYTTDKIPRAGLTSRKHYCLGVFKCPAKECPFVARPAIPPKISVGAPPKTPRNCCIDHPDHNLVWVPCNAGPRLTRFGTKPCLFEVKQATDGSDSSATVTHLGHHDHELPPLKPREITVKPRIIKEAPKQHTETAHLQLYGTSQALYMQPGEACI